MKRLKKQSQTLILNGLYNSFREVFLIFFCVDADRGIHKWRHYFLKGKETGICKYLWHILSKFLGEKTNDFIYGWPLRGVTFTHNNTEAIGRGQIRKMHILWQKLIHLTFVKITSLKLQMSISIRINENFASYFYCEITSINNFGS